MVPEWVGTFLSALRRSPNVSAAARAAGVTRQAVYLYRESDPDFARAWDDALAESTDHLVGEAYRRAFEGTDEPVFYKGEECGTVRKYSDTLTCFLLKAHRRDVYGDKVTQEVTMDVNARIEIPDDDPRFVAEGGRPAEAGDPEPDPAEGADDLRSGGDR
jgi:hypothetical protein